MIFVSQPRIRSPIRRMPVHSGSLAVAFPIDEKQPARASQHEEPAGLYRFANAGHSTC